MAIKNYTESWIDTYNKYLGSIKFTEGDFNGLKEVIRDYVVRQNPEGYNDWQESSEVGMFVNAVAYLGENTLYRTDLNVNDLFPTTTERKQSLLNFTKMLSYASKRNICANGLAKLVAVSTTQDITDTSGTLLKGVTIKWNDKTNEDWMEQFLTVLNSAFVYTNQFGKPTKTVSISSISNQLYQLNSSVNNNCTYSFRTTINGKNQQFEVVNPDIDVTSSSIVELTPIPERMFQLLYRNDGAGNSSSNTGFFVYWKQGTLANEIYNFDEKIQNNVVDVPKDNVNNDDVWFEELDKNTGYVSNIWTKLDASEYLSYTNTSNDIRTIYKVETQENDRIKVKFSDGYFGDIPYGLYRLWYRTSNGNDGLYIKPSDISNISIQIPYFNNSNSSEDNIYYLTLTFSVVDVSHIRQSVPSESLESIRERAPEVYSTQDRMVTSKDYNYFPKSIGQQLKVLKAVERTYAGNSRFIDINDPTGTYKPVNVVATDGYLYMETVAIKSAITIGAMEADKIFERYIEPKLSLKEISNLYYQNYPGKIIPQDSGEEVSYYYWVPQKISLGQNTMIGGFKKATQGYNTNTDSQGTPICYDDSIISFSYDYIDSEDMAVGDMLCFEEFTLNGNADVDTKNIVWARIESINTDNNTDETFVTISEVLDTNKLWKIRKSTEEGQYSKLMNFNTSMSKTVEDQIIDRLTRSENETSFGITYSSDNTSERSAGWFIVDMDEETRPMLEKEDLEMTNYGSTLAANWIIRVIYNTTTSSWEITTHETRIVFGSKEQASFFFNTSNKDASNDGYFITKDVIEILKNQNDEEIKLDSNYYWKPYNVIKYVDGYVDTQEFCCEAYDNDKDSVVDVPTQYSDIVAKQKDLIFIRNTDSEDSTSELEFLDYVDLNSIYLNLKDQNLSLADYNSSLWERTKESGWYYSYHKIREVIPAYGKSSFGSTKLITPNHRNAKLSNGTITSFAHGPQEIDGKKNTFDFVDFIRGFDEETGKVNYYEDFDDDGNRIEPDKVVHGYLYYYDAETKKFTNGRAFDKEAGEYEMVKGLSGLTFLWKHYPTTDYVIDPCSTNIIDMFVLTNTYYNQVQEWVQNGKRTVFPKAPSAYELKSTFATLENNKMISDTMVWHPVTYKLIFGPTADTDTHCIFKVIKADNLLSDNEVKKQVVQCIDKFFQSMGVGETFYFTQLSTYIENQLKNMIKTVVIVPTDTTNKFGNLFQIRCDDNEILLSSATLEDVQIISSITTQNIRVSS